MKLIVITRPDFFDGEAEAITDLFQNGLETLHLRKPHATAEAVKVLLQQLPEEFMDRIVLHEHFELTECYSLKGIHLNQRNPKAPEGYAKQVGCSCHSIEEVQRRKSSCHYVFLSPIYDSISKVGYGASYPLEQLQQAQQEGIIDEKVIALGGITLQRLPEIQTLGFGGAALLGDIWQQTKEQFIPHFQEVRSFFKKQLNR